MQNWARSGGRIWHVCQRGVTARSTPRKQTVGRVATMKKLAGTLLFVISTSYLRVATCEGSCSPQTRPRSPEEVLKDELLCDYVKEKTRAVEMREAVMVTSAIMLKSIDYNEKFSGSEAKIKTVIDWKWTDIGLTWEPAHRGISSIWMDPKTIWTPDAWIYSATDFMDFSTGKCLLSSGGQISCAIPTTFRVPCNADMTFWPFDTHTCTANLAIGSYMSNVFNYSVDESSMKTPDYSSSREWELLNVEVKMISHSGYGALVFLFTYTVKLKRHSALYAATLLLPALVLPVFTVTSFLLNPESIIRLFVCCVNIFTHTLFIQDLGYAVPSNGENAPRIIMYYRDSMVLAGITLLLAVMVQWLCSKNNNPPTWCESAITWILHSRCLHASLLISPEEQNAIASRAEDETAVDNVLAGVSETNPRLSWKFVVHVADRIFFFLFTMLSSILLLVRIL